MFSDKQLNSSNKGAIGENIASEYLIKNGIKIIERNHKNSLGEIDIIGISPDDKMLIFFEVKTIYDYDIINQISPEDNFSSAKRKKLIKSCEMFVAKHPELVTNNGWRIDLISLTINNKDCNIKIYENV